MRSPPRRAKHLVCTWNLRAGSAEPVLVCRDPLGPSWFRVFCVCDPTNAAEPDYGFCATRGLLSWLPLGNLPLPRKKKKVFPFGLTSCNSGRGTIVSEGLPCGARRGGAKHLVCTWNLRAGSAEPVLVCRDPAWFLLTLRMPQNRTTGSALSFSTGGLREQDSSLKMAAFRKGK